MPRPIPTSRNTWKAWSKIGRCSSTLQWVAATALVVAGVALFALL